MPKQPAYRLQSLLEVRERAKHDAEQALGAAIAVHRAELEKHRQLATELARMVARREQKERDYAEKAMRGRMSAQEVVAGHDFVERLKHEEKAQERALEAQQAVVAEKEAAVQAAREVLVKAAQALLALEKHKQKLVDDWRKGVQAQDEETMDEVAQQIFMRRDPS